MTKVIEPSDISLLVESLNIGEVVSFPTETVYGLGCIYGNKDALQKIFEIKKRSQSKAITLMVRHIEDIYKYAYVSEKALKVLKAFMPGRITVILPKRDNVSDEVTQGLKTIGIRIPDNDFVLQLLQLCGPLFVTSANISGEHNTTNEREVLQQLDGKISYVVKGQTESTLASTVVSLDDKVQVLRKGSITQEEIEEVFYS